MSENIQNIPIIPTAGSAPQSCKRWEEFVSLLNIWAYRRYGEVSQAIEVRVVPSNAVLGNKASIIAMWDGAQKTIFVKENVVAAVEEDYDPSSMMITIHEFIHSLQTAMMPIKKAKKQRSTVNNYGKVITEGLPSLIAERYFPEIRKSLQREDEQHMLKSSLVRPVYSPFVDFLDAMLRKAHKIYGIDIDDEIASWVHDGAGMTGGGDVAIRSFAQHIVDSQGESMTKREKKRQTDNIVANLVAGASRVYSEYYAAERGQRKFFRGIGIAEGLYAIKNIQRIVPMETHRRKESNGMRQDEPMVRAHKLSDRFTRGGIE